MTTEDTTIVIPAASFSKFGIITDGYSGESFTENGHWLKSIKMSSMSLSSAKPEPIEKVKLQNQLNKSGGTALMKVRFPEPCVIDFGVVCYTCENDSKRVSDLFNSLNAEIRRTLTTNQRSVEMRYIESYIGRLEAVKYKDKAFIVSEMMTINIKTGHACIWKSGKYVIVNKNGKRHNDLRMGLTHVNGAECDRLAWEVLREAAGDMFEDICENGTVTRSTCKIKAADENKKRSKAKINL